MKTRRSRTAPQRVELGRYIVADPHICHGKVTFRNTRVFVSDVLADIERGLSWDVITERWGQKITREALAEAIHLSRNALLAHDGTLAPEAAARAKLLAAA